MPKVLPGWITLCLLALTASVRAEVPVRLEVQPTAIELSGAEARHRILATAIAADGSRQDVSAGVSFTSQNPTVVTVTNGEFRPAGDGEAEVVVKYQNLQAAVKVIVKDAASVRPTSFLNDVMPIFTRLGCNQGSCHGKGAGQNGFRLSLRGYAPELDYPGLTREFTGRRIDTAVPENSLLVLKPLAKAPHEGGRAMIDGSREHQVLLDWIRAGAKGPVADDPHVKHIEILPGNRLAKVGDEQQLLVRAEYSDGRWLDVTWLTKFESNDAGIVEVTPEGKAIVRRQGETAIRAAFQGQVAIVGFTVPYEQKIPAERYGKKNNFIDEHVMAKLQALGIEPSDLSSDAEFIRRAFLDTIGTLPTAAEVKAFLADPAPNKRAKLIDQLLERPEFVDFWALQLADLFQNRKERDHDVRGTKGVRAFHAWLREQVQANRPWDQLARAVLTASGPTSTSPAVGYYVVVIGEQRQQEKSEVVASVAQAFLGTRIGCAQCHNHPLEKYTQDDYYHFAGFFSRVKLDRKAPDKGPTVLLTAASNPQDEKKPIGVTQPRTGKFLKPQPLDRSAVEIPAGSDPRVLLAEWMTDPKNDYFAGNIVNRIWRHYFSVGLVEPVDDLRATNPPSNQPLWNALCKDLVEKKFDLKHLMRVILNSRTYQLSSATRPTNVNDSRFYSHYNARRLPAEVFLDAITLSTDVPDSYPGYPVGVRAIQLADPTLRSYFLTMFGRSERVTACACERSGEVTMPQLLHLQNGDSVVRKVKAADGRLAKLLQAKATDDQIIEELFLSTLARQPSPEQVDKIKKSLTDDQRDEVFRDLFWALLNSKEFAFNH